MAALYFFMCFILKLTLVTGQSVHYVLKGREAILSPPLSSAPDDILWKHNGDKVITFDSAEERVFPPYEGRVTLGWGTAELTIADVRYEDSGEYELDAFIRGRLHRSQYMLKVLDKVSKPVIQCEMNDDSGNSTFVRRATLRCSSDSNTPEALTFKWNLEGKTQLGQALPIALGNDHDSIEYSCTATNPLHAETSKFMAKDCHIERSSEALDIIVPIVIASLILLALCIFPVIFRHQIKRACLKQGKNNDLEKQMNAAADNDDEDGSPLMGDIHRQETFASKQPLIQQNDFVRVTPQRQEIAQELDELRSSKKVQKGSKKFSDREHTESQPDTQTEEENDMDNVETVTPQPASPIRNGQVDSDTDLSRQDIYSAPKSEGGSDAHSNHSTYHDATETTEPQDSKPGEHESRGQTDSKEEPDVYHLDHEGATKTDEASDSSSVHSGQGGETKAPEQAELLSQPHIQSSVPQQDEQLQSTNNGLAESNEEFKLESIVDQEPQKDPSDSLLQPSHQSNAPVLDRGSSSQPVVPVSKEQTDPEEKPTLALVDKDTQADAPQNKSVTSEHEKGSESLLQSPPQSSLPADKDSQVASEDKNKTDSDEEANSNETPSGLSRDDSARSEPTPPESGESGLTNEQESPSDIESSDSQPQSSPQSRSDQNSKLEPVELENQKTSPETKPNPADEDPLSDSVHENVSSDDKADKTGTDEMGVQSSPSDSKQSEPQSPSPGSDPQDKLKSNEHGGGGQTSSVREPDVHHSGEGDEGAPNTDVAVHSRTVDSGQEEAIKTPEQAGSEKASR